MSLSGGHFVSVDVCDFSVCLWSLCESLRLLCMSLWLFFVSLC